MRSCTRAVRNDGSARHRETVARRATRSMDWDQRTMSGSSRKVILTLGLVGVFSLVSVAFLPVFFVVEDVSTMRAPHTINGHSVVSYGRSRLSKMTYEDGHQMSGKVFDGMCFVEYEHGGDTKRQSGRSLTVRTFYDSTVSRVVRTEYVIR